MRVVGSNRFILCPNEEKALIFMAKEGSFVDVDVEEGEISEETQSIEEISAEDFKQESKPRSGSGGGGGGGGGNGGEVWMDDLYKFRVSSNYGHGLHNLAWARAVQNKPLDEILDKLKRSSALSNGDIDEDGNGSKRSSKSGSNSKEVCNIIIDDSSDEEVDSRVQNADQGEKEEGELEEGEIDMDSEMLIGDGKEGAFGELDYEGELGKKIRTIRDGLDNVTVKDAEKSFSGVCSQLYTCFDFMLEIASESCPPALDAIKQQAFTGFRAVNTVFVAMNSKQQELNKEAFSRLLDHIKSKASSLFSPGQLQEVEAAILSMVQKSSSLSNKSSEKEKETYANNRNNPNELGLWGSKPGPVSNPSKLSDPLTVETVDQRKIIGGFDISKQGLLSGFKSRGTFGPLLDLHGDHDVDSLPSPTRETPPTTFTSPKPQITGNDLVKSVLAAPSAADTIVGAIAHSYETDALKAVSTYQQKFSRTSLFMNSELPSPTPSEECEIGDGDSNGEVSSSSKSANTSTVNLPVQSEPFCSSASHLSGASLVIPTNNIRQSGPGPNVSIKSSAKSRDPRLRFANSEAGNFDLNQGPTVTRRLNNEPFGGQIGSRKSKVADEFGLDGHASKRQRNGLVSSMVSRDAQMVSVSGGWLEDNNTVQSFTSDKRRMEGSLRTDNRQSVNGENVFVRGKNAASSILDAANRSNKQPQLIGTSSTVSLPSLLKDIAVNPTMLVQLLLEQQKLAEAQKKSSYPVQNTTSTFSSSVNPGTVPVANALPSNSFPIEQRVMAKPRDDLPVTSMSQNGQVEGGKIRMKPRDPRRILHSAMFNKNGDLRTEAPSNNHTVKDNLLVRQLGEQAQTASVPSQPSQPPDISRQFTKELKNLAALTSQAINASTVPLTGSSQPLPVKMEKSNVGVVTDTNEQQSNLKPEEGAVGAPKPQNAWGDVEHLFEGYDDQQRAAIQRERTRRIEEQNKMFSAQKLCLVLDLDHTLLNSAKFIEVDPVHEEILRKKEEQDREKSQRHLFRFAHMGMWTKLRPGIWNFLEKASKLFELHLYTMGNKLYATEMAKVLDPTGVLFAGRVISKGDDGDPFDGEERVPKSKDLEGVLGMESAVIIIDDSIRVWPHNKLNLIVVERYTYFPCSRRQFGLPGPSLLEIDHDERPEDGTLASSLSVIERIHQNFFSNRSLHDIDVRNILASEQRKILGGCRIVFSRVFPVGEANPHLHPLWQNAEQFGAVCTTQIDEQVTHVVANSRGTDKVNWAISTGRFVVQPGWVEASALLYRRANEHDFAI
ncbi:hypothetical protein Sjap_023193 [Stephania japonica]|uniref:protein-serine/threonine phosphatase n=1 Tax=Stephania japonica TaxID=461633 RepID=A0AAP0HMQ8_9MAGN